MRIGYVTFTKRAKQLILLQWLLVAIILTAFSVLKYKGAVGVVLLFFALFIVFFSMKKAIQKALIEHPVKDS